MQKEALVATAGGRVWRMACDEGPYLNGTDLAPFPLAFFTVGLVNSYLAEIVASARARGVAVRRLEIVQDSFYTMAGSAVRGDMVGGAQPVELNVRIEADPSQNFIDDLVMSAIARSPADALLRTALANEFSIVNNGERMQPGTARPWTAPDIDLPAASFDQAEPDTTADFPPDVIAKLDSAHSVFGVEGGAGSSLQAEQKRTLHVRGVAAIREDGLGETRVQLFKPLGSNFRFLCALGDDREEQARAPSPLAYLSAGIAFCYLTQVGRYASIMKLALHRYAIAQDTVFGLARGDGNRSSAEPVRTEDDDTVRRIVDMGERTCFLHAACRMPLESKVRVAESSA
jgi:hypothetical protein